KLCASTTRANATISLTDCIVNIVRFGGQYVRGAAANQGWEPSLCLSPKSHPYARESAMQTSPNAIILTAGAGDVVDVLGAPATYKASAECTGGRFSVFEQAIPAGYSVPLHRHAAEDEAMYVLEGEIALEGEAGTHCLGAGGFVFLPRGHFHGFRNAGSAPAR